MTMKTYARINEGRVAELFATDGNIAELFHPALVWVECGGSVSVGDAYADGSFSPPPPPPIEQQIEALRASARVTLSESDITVLRCAEAGVAVPQAWRDYRAALRLIVSSDVGDPEAGLPARPEYPPGT